MPIDPADVEKAISLIKKGSVNADYFFDKLSSPEWIDPLEKAGFFSKPYEAVQQGDMVSFPVWVPGLYLVKMAAKPEAQQAIARILKNLPESDNPRVYEVMADVANALPPRLSQSLLPQLLRGIEGKFQLLLPEKIGSVIVNLAEGGLSADALRLARTLLAITTPPASAGDTNEDEMGISLLSRDASGRMDDWHYGKVLERIVGPLTAKSGMAAFTMLCDLLEAAVEAGRKSAKNDPYDYSYVWRPSVEHEEGHRDNIRDELVSAVRDSAMQIAQSTPAKFREVVDHLQSRPVRIFHRLAFYLLLKNGSQEIGIVEEALKKVDNWDDPSLHPEYELTLSEYFGRLSPELQKEYFEWIDKGPNSEEYIAFRERMDGTKPKDAEIQLHRDVWIRDHLGVLSKDLPAEAGARLVDLERIGPRREVGRQLYKVTVGWRGDQSPLSEEETLSFAWPALLAKAREWTAPPNSDFEGPSKAGLARSIRQRVAANTGDAIAHLSDATDLSPEYLAAIFEALREAVKKGEKLDWKVLLKFVQTVLQVAQESKALETDWRWVCKCIASLVDDGLEGEEAAIPVQHREQVWAILELLAAHPDPTPAHEEQYGGSNMDPSTLSLNTVRGETFHAVVRYGLWWRRHLESLEGGTERVESGFEEMPEMRALLDRHLDPNIEPALAVRAVYGQWFPWLLLIDPKWGDEKATAIFPVDEGSKSLFWAAWGTYIVYCRPYTSVLPVLRAIYQHAIQVLGENEPAKVGLSERPSEHLATHLMAFYWRGELPLTEGDLVATFFALADPKVKGHAIEWIGRAMSQAEEEIPAEALRRLEALWEARLASNITPPELESFGWWFSSGEMNQEWSLRNLETVLDRGVMPEPDHMVVERLAAVADSRPQVAVGYLDRMIRLAKHSWTIHGWLDSAKAILTTALGSSDDATRRDAERVINHLGGMGFGEFRALLK